MEFRSVIAKIQGLSVLFRGASDPIIIDAYIRINIHDLSGEFSRQASMLAYISAKLAEAEWVEARCKAALEQTYATLDSSYRYSYELEGRKYTEAVIRSAILQDVEYKDLQEQHMELDYHVGLIKGIVTALKQRGDMLISLGAQSRMEAEMTGLHMDTYTDEMVKSAKKHLHKSA